MENTVSRVVSKYDYCHYGIDLQERLENILALFVRKVLEVTYNTVMVANIGFTRSAAILRIDYDTMRVIVAESRQVKLRFMMAHK